MRSYEGFFVLLAVTRLDLRKNLKLMWDKGGTIPGLKEENISMF